MERYLKQQREEGGLAPKRRPGRRPSLSEAQAEALRENLGREPGLTLAERCDWLYEHEGVKLSVPTMYRWVKRLMYSRKEARERPIERNEQGGWSFPLVRRLDPRKLVFLDETSTTIGMRREHAYAPQGQRAHAGFLRNFGLNRTLLAAMSLDGVLPSFLVDGV